MSACSEASARFIKDSELSKKTTVRPAPVGEGAVPKGAAAFFNTHHIATLQTPQVAAVRSYKPRPLDHGRASDPLAKATPASRRSHLVCSCPPRASHPPQIRTPLGVHESVQEEERELQTGGQGKGGGSTAQGQIACPARETRESSTRSSTPGPAPSGRGRLPHVPYPRALL